MSCFFCTSTSHPSQFCDVFVTDEIRKDIIGSKNYCYLCLNVKNNVHGKCEIDQKCYICFSRTHHTFLCPERLTAPKLFIPKIDIDLVKRLSEMLTLEEKFALISTVPNLAALINFKSFAVVNDKGFGKQPERNLNIVVENVLKMCYVNSPLFSSVVLKDIILKPALIYLTNLTISSQDLFLLLSAKTTVMDCCNVNIETNATFMDIIMRAPNIEIFKAEQSHIEVESTWIQGLLKYKQGNNFKALTLGIRDMSLSLKDLIAFIKTKSVKNAYFNLSFIVPPEPFDTKEYLKNIQFAKYFKPVKKRPLDRPFIKISFADEISTILGWCYLERSPSKEFALKI